MFAGHQSTHRLEGVKALVLTQHTHSSNRCRHFRAYHIRKKTKGEQCSVHFVQNTVLNQTRPLDLETQSSRKGERKDEIRKQVGRRV